MHHHRNAFCKYRTDRPHQRHFSPAGFVPQGRGSLSNPGGGIIIAYIEEDKVPSLEVDCSVTVQIASVHQLLMCHPLLGILFLKRKMLPEGGVSQCSQSDGIGILKGIISTDNTGKLPLGSYIFMLSSGVLRIFINPARETSDIAEFLSFILLIGFLQKSFQYLQVQSFFLCRIICCRLVSPRRKVKEESFLADKKVMIGQLVMVRYRPGRIGTPELVDVISGVLRIA